MATVIIILGVRIVGLGVGWYFIFVRDHAIDTGVETANGHGISALDATTSEVQWQFEDTQRFSRSQKMSVLRVRNGLVFAVPYGPVYGPERTESRGIKRGLSAIDAASGEERWFYTSDQRATELVAVYDRNGAVVVYLRPREAEPEAEDEFDDGVFVNLDINSGNVRWRHADPYSLGIREIYAGQSNLYVEYQEDSITAHRVSDLSAGYDASRAWNTSFSGGVAITDRREADGIVYFATTLGDTYAYDSADGTLLWDTSLSPTPNWVMPADGPLYYGFDHAGVGALRIEPINLSDDTSSATDDSNSETTGNLVPPISQPGFTGPLGVIAVAVALLVVVLRRRQER